jgi:hypothetical protein
MTYRIATGKQHGLAAGCASNVAGCGLHAGVNSKGCAVTYFEESPALGYQKKGWHNNLWQSAHPT